MNRAEDRELGTDQPIDRRDFIGMTLAGLGAALIPGADATAKRASPADALGWTMSASDFDGPGGQGDYAGCNGNTWRVVNAAHRIRDGLIDTAKGDVTRTGETYDLLVVGGGPAGLGAAYHFRKRAPESSRCLVLDNHDVLGGLAKRNELDVDGTRLMAPQGSNVFVSSAEPRERMIAPEILEDIGLSTDALEYATLEGSRADLEFDRTNFVYYYPPADSASLGFFSEDGAGYALSRNPWRNAFADSTLPASLQRELMRWRFETSVPDDVKDTDRWLDSMSYQQYLQDVHGFSAELCRVVNQFIGGGKAFNGEICSAYAMSFNRYPGLVQRPFRSLEETYRASDAGAVRIDGFPGGNALTARYFARYLVPDAIPGTLTPSNLVNTPLSAAALDRAGQPTRIRNGATVVSVSHDDEPGAAGSVSVVYESGGKLYEVRGKAVVMATGSWVNKHVLQDAPEPLQQALGRIRHAPTLVANVALRDWRFMERAGVTACLWDRGDFGFQCNLRRPLRVGDYRPPLDPGKPIFLTFYAPFVYPGQSAAAQLARGRQELFSTPFADFERRIRRQLTRMFGRYGFDAARDIAGIITNRWGHAYVVPEPGFYFGSDDRPPPREIIRSGYGRIAVGHSELYGFQSYETAVLQSEQAVERVMAFTQ